MVMCDLPYGTTRNQWDSVIPLDELWAAYRRVCKKNAAIVLTAAQPFTSALVMSNPADFKYEWMWVKSPSGNLNAKKMPMAGHESVLVFSSGKTRYQPQGLIHAPFTRKANSVSKTGNYGNQVAKDYVQEFTNYPHTRLEFKKDKDKHHPTQKPVALLSYLINTYTLPGETVLDSTMGSGSTGVACMETRRNFIGIEREQNYFDIATARIGAARDKTIAEIHAEIDAL